MTYQVGLAIECRDFASATQVSNYFSVWVATHTGILIRSLTKVKGHQDSENNYWITIYHKYDLAPPNLAYLYDALQVSKLDYRYALAGIEVDEFRTYSELIEDLPTIDIPGLVISSKLIKKANKNSYKIFSEGYFWQPYKPPHNLVN
jgi:hypothetical protein